MAAAVGMSGFQAQWLGWSARFAALQQREKIMVVGAVLVAILFGGYSLWIEPAQLQKTRLKKSIDQQQAEEAQLRTQLAALIAQSSDPDAVNRSVLVQLQKQLTETERDIHGFDRVLVAPAQAPALLQTLLARHRGLTLASLATLPPQPLIAVATKVAPKDGGGAGRVGEEAPAMPGGNIYKHGIEIKLTGNYHDLMAYVGELESGPQKLIRGTMRLAVQKHPVSELTLTVYTLSLEAIWLEV
jgi:MSHA biogenesis protein MshJ